MTHHDGMKLDGNVLERTCTQQSRQSWEVHADLIFVFHGQRVVGCAVSDPGLQHAQRSSIGIEVDPGFPVDERETVGVAGQRLDEILEGGRAAQEVGSFEAADILEELEHAGGAEVCRERLHLVWLQSLFLGVRLEQLTCFLLLDDAEFVHVDVGSMDIGVGILDRSPHLFTLHSGPQPIEEDALFFGG